MKREFISRKIVYENQNLLPILLTAGAVVLGAVIILFDPIFQGLAISLMGGTTTSTFLTLLVVPLIYYRLLRKKYSAKK